MQARASFAVNSLPKNSFNVLRLMGSEKSRRATLAFVSNAKGLKSARRETNDHTSASSEWKAGHTMFHDAGSPVKLGVAMSAWLRLRFGNAHRMACFSQRPRQSGA